MPAHFASGELDAWGTQLAHRALQLEWGVCPVPYTHRHCRTQLIARLTAAWSSALVFISLL